VANSPQARKRAKQNTVRRLRNASQKSYKAAVSEIDSATQKGLHHANRGARLKSRLNRRVQAL